MAFFGLFSGEKHTVRCARCNNAIKKGDIKGHQGEVYCSFCYNHILADEREKKAASSQQKMKRTINVDLTHDYRQVPDRLKQIQKVFDETNTKYRMNHFGDQWELVAGVNGKANIFEIKYICKEDPKSAIAVRVFSLAHIENHQKGKMLGVLNSLNEKYRFVRFTLDSDNDVKVEYDIPIETTSLGPVALELLIRTVSIIDEAYPELMRELWG